MLAANRFIYVWKLLKPANEFIDGCDIFGGDITVPGMTLSSDNYEGRSRDITILPAMAQKMGGPLTHEERFILRSGRGKLMRISRIARHCALYGASIAAKTFDALYQVVLNPIDFDEVIDVHIENAAGYIKSPYRRI